MANTDTFLLNIAPIIVSVAKKRGYKYPSAIIAQAASESAWGKSLLSSKYHNYFGMKCGSAWRGKSVNMTTKEEYIAGKTTTIKDNFRAYNSDIEGINGYFDFIESFSRYKNLKSATSAYDYIVKLKSDGWATSSQYVKVLYNIWTYHNLKRYDESNIDVYADLVERVAREVISGKWGVNPQRKQRLTAAGYDYDVIQKRVNAILSGK